MATFNKFNSFVAACANKVHNLGSDAITVALTNTLPSAANTQLSNITEISYANLSTRVLNITSSAQVDGVYRLIADDLVLTASGTVPTFRYVVLYNDTATNKELIGWYDYGSAVDMNNGETFTIDSHQTNGILSLT